MNFIKVLFENELNESSQVTLIYNFEYSFHGWKNYICFNLSRNSFEDKNNNIKLIIEFKNNNNINKLKVESSIFQKTVHIAGISFLFYVILINVYFSWIKLWKLYILQSFSIISLFIYYLF